MSEKQRPMVSFHCGSLGAAYWETERRNGEGTRKSVSVRKSVYNKDRNEFDEMVIWLNVTEVSCLADLLAKMANAVVDQRGAEGDPF